MKRSENASLKHLNSFSVEACAGLLLEMESEHDLQVLMTEHPFDIEHDLILGGGSNILFARDVDGTVVLNRVRGKCIVAESNGEVLVEAHAGENWHGLVLWSLEQGLSGIENLSLIPGLVGAAPIQNIGAYGVELASVIDTVQALDLESGQLRNFKHDDCRFGYRDSRFKSADAGRFLISRIRLRLKRAFKANLDYAGIGEELKAMGVNNPTAQQVSDAVIRIRRRKLPDPEVIGNAGSFFKNPVVELAAARQLAQEFNDLPVYATNDGAAKLSAAWMIEQCGWKGYRQGEAGISQQHALVLVNHGHATGRQLLELADTIRDSVKSRYGIELMPEPRIIR